MARSPMGRALAQWSWIFRHQNSVLAALPVGQVVLSVLRAAEDVFCFANRDKKELAQSFAVGSVRKSNPV